MSSSHTNKSSRRKFLKTGVGASLAGLAIPYFAPSHVLGRSVTGKPAPSDTFILGAIGTGGRARADNGALSRFEDVKYAACADPDLGRAQSSASTLKAADVFQDYRRLLENKDIDAVVIASPDHWHALHAIHAAQAGKHMYVEKAMTLTVVEGRRMAEAIQKYNLVLQVGSQQRSDRNFHRACMLVRNGYLGDIQKVIAVNFPGAWESKLPAQPIPANLDWDMWLGPVEGVPFNENVRTSRSKPGWLSIKEFCGGEICGWGAHDLDQVQWALGMDDTGPTEIWVEGNPYKPWVAEDDSRTGRFFGQKDPVIHYRYANGIHVECSEDKNPDGGGVFIGTKGQLRIERGRFEVSNEEWKTVDLSKMPIQLYTSENHYRNWLDCIRDNKKPVCDVEIGHRSATMCHLGNIARWLSQDTQETGVVLKWDPVKEQFTNNKKANTYLDRPRRKGWELPKKV